MGVVAPGEKNKVNFEYANFSGPTYDSYNVHRPLGDNSSYYEIPHFVFKGQKVNRA